MPIGIILCLVIIVMAIAMLPIGQLPPSAIKYLFGVTLGVTLMVYFFGHRRGQSSRRRRRPIVVGEDAQEPRRSG